MSTNSSSKRVALVTGANKGLGKEIARQLGLAGFTVVVTSRDEAAGSRAVEELRAAGADVVGARLEVTDEAQIAALVRFVEERFGRLDVLVNNAGISLDWDGTPATLEKFDRTLVTNVSAPWAITEAFAGLLAKSDDARVINQSSQLGSIATCDSMWEHMGAFFTPAYASSKAALNMVSVIHAKKLGAQGILVTAAHPGWVKTDLGGDAAPMDVKDGAHTVVTLATMDRASFPVARLVHEGNVLPW